MKSLRLLGYFGVSIVIVSTLTGSYYHEPASDPVATVVGFGLIVMAAALAVFVWRRPGSVELLVGSWICALTLVGVQLTGGFDGPGMAAYLLLLAWLALPSVGGPAALTGLGLGVIEAVSGIVRAGGGFETAMEQLIPSLRYLVPLTLFGAAAEWLGDREADLSGRRRTAEGERRRSSRSKLEDSGSPDLEGIARNFLPLVHDLSKAMGTFLLLRHGDEFFRLADFLGGEGSVLKEANVLIHRNHPVLSRAMIDGSRVEKRLEEDGEERCPVDLPWLDEGTVFGQLLAFPVIWSGKPEAVLVFILSSPDPPDPGFFTAVEETTSSIESIARYMLPRPGAGKQDAAWFDSLLRRSAVANDIRLAVHTVIDAMRTVFDQATVSVAFCSDDGRRVEVYESVGPLSRNRAGRSFGIDEGLAGWVLRHGRLLRRNRMRLGDRAVRTFSAKDDPDRKAGSLLAFPVFFTRGECAGILVLEKEEDDGFSTADEPLVSGVSALLGLNLERLIVMEKRRDSVGRDFLTGLPGHSEFHDHLRDEVKEVRRYGRPVSVLMVDIDDFASVNRRAGHRGGDELLKAVAGRIQDALGTGAIIARYGPDCFAACLPGVDRAEAEAYSERIVASISGEPYTISTGEELIVSVSVGGCTTHTDRRVGMLPIEAEKALARARSAGGGRSVITELQPNPPPDGVGEQAAGDEEEEAAR